VGPGGNDVLDGGPGRDDTSYSRTAPVTITLDGVANDGEAGEADNVQVEDVFTGDGNDTITWTTPTGHSYESRPPPILGWGNTPPPRLKRLPFIEIHTHPLNAEYTSKHHRWPGENSV
jgi:hypothetical protein